MKQTARDRLPEMLDWRALGVPDAEIARRVGVSRQRVNRLMGPRRPKAKGPVPVLLRKPAPKRKLAGGPWGKRFRPKNTVKAST
jgi:hypothetical protein